MARQTELPGRLGTGLAAVPLMLGGMLGVGLFTGLGLAAASASVLMVLAVPLAGLTAACCAVSSAHLSEYYRGPGAVYGGARARLGVVPARISASTHFAGHVAAMAAISGSIADHLAASSALPPTARPGVAAAVVFVVVLASTAGLRIRGPAAWLWLLIPVVVLGIVVAAALSITPPPSPHGPASAQGDGFGITAAAGMMFFAYLGFERVTSPGQERDRFAQRTVRRALMWSLLLATAIYLLVGGALLHQLGSARLALSRTPMTDVLYAAGAANLRPLVGVGIALALLPILLGVLESVRSTALAVGRDGDLPVALTVGSRETPYRLDLLTGALAATSAVLFEPRQLIPFAACCVLVHYALGNAGARVLLSDGPTGPMRGACLGMGLAIILAMSMPVPAMVGTLAVVVAGPVLAGLISRRWG